VPDAAVRDAESELEALLDRSEGERPWAIRDELASTMHENFGVFRREDQMEAQGEIVAGLRERYRPYPFLREEMADALCAADLVVGRAGSSTIAEATALGTPIVLVPYPHAAGHQAANARAAAGTGAALVIRDEEFDGPALLTAVGILADPHQHLEMAAASRALGRPGAADAVAALVLALADRRPLPPISEMDAIARGRTA